MQTEKVLDFITDWLKEYVASSRTKGFVVGVSGGVDSALVSTLCAKTGIPTLCAELPIHQNKNQVTLAVNHITWLKKNFANVTNIQVDLTQTFEQLKGALPYTEKNKELELTLANTRARLRMTTLYYFAGLHGYLVAGTGNKIEDFGIGFFTKYGDGGVDISPIADLMKSEVRELGRALNISEKILKAHPTDGLFGDSRTDEQQIGASYEELEQIMGMIKAGTPENKLSARQKEVFKIYSTRHAANKHKTLPIPVCKIPVHLK